MFTRVRQEESLFLVDTLHSELMPALVDFDFGFLRDLERACIAALSVVDVDHKVSCLTCEEEILRHGNLQASFLAVHQADNFL